MFSHNGYGPGTRARGPKAAGPGARSSSFGVWSFVPGPFPLWLNICASRIISRQSISNIWKVILFIACRICNKCPRTSQHINKRRTRVFVKTFWISSPFRVQPTWATRIIIGWRTNCMFVVFVLFVYRQFRILWALFSGTCSKEIFVSSLSTRYSKYSVTLTWHNKKSRPQQHTHKLW